MVVLRVRGWECSKGSVSCGIDQNWPSVCACSLYLPVLSTFFVAPWYNRKLTPQGGTTFMSVSPLARSQNSVCVNLRWKWAFAIFKLILFSNWNKKLLKEENEMMFISNLFNFVLELYLVSTGFFGQKYKISLWNSVVVMTIKGQPHSLERRARYILPLRHQYMQSDKNKQTDL